VRGLATDVLLLDGCGTIASTGIARSSSAKILRPVFFTILENFGNSTPSTSTIESFLEGRAGSEGVLSVLGLKKLPLTKVSALPRGANLDT